MAGLAGAWCTCDDGVGGAIEVGPDGYGKPLSRLKDRVRAGRVGAAPAANIEVLRRC